MKIILKFVARSIKEKKFRTFLILFAIAVSAALFFASSAISGSIEKIYINKLSSNYGTADILIFAGDKSPSKYFDMNKIGDSSSKISYAIGAMSEAGIYKVNDKENLTFNLRGINFSDLQMMNPVDFISKGTIQPFSGKKIIISSFTARKYNKDVGDYIDLNINNEKYKFTICGIVGTNGFFANDLQSVCGVVPLETLSSIMEAKGEVTTAYIKAKNQSSEQSIIDTLKKQYRNYSVQKAISDEDINQEVSSFTTPFMMMTIVVLGMSIFITYTAFKVIALERLPIVGTFRSAGATKKTTNLILILESVVYGITGGIIGDILGLCVLYLMTYLTTPDWMRGNGIQVQFSVGQLIIAFILAVAISILSALLPIVRMSKLPVKEVILNEVEGAKEKGLWKLILGIICFLIAFKLPDIAPKSLALYLDMLSMTLAIIGVVMLVPHITKIFVKIFEKVYSISFGNEGVLAAKNLRENKSVLNNISLLAIGLSALLMINTVSHSVSVEVLDAYSKFNLNIEMWDNFLDKNTEQLLQNVQGVTETYGEYRTSLKIANTDRTIDMVQGVSNSKYFDFISENINNQGETIKQLNEDRNILLTDALLSRMNLKVGDTITFDIKNRKRQYKIIGSFNSVMDNGSYAIIGQKYFKSDTGIKYFSSIDIKTNEDETIVKDRISKRLQNLRPNLMTKSEMENMDKSTNEQMFNVLNAFSIMALVIGIFGIINNLIISFIQRKKSLAVFRSVGMSKPQMIKVLFIEAFSAGIVGGITGVIAGSLMIYIVPKVCEAMNLPLQVDYLWTLFFYAFIGGIVINVVASIVPAFKSSKLNIIDTIKYE